MQDTFTIRGTVHTVLTRADGSIEERTFPNLVVTTGKTFIASRMSSASASVMGWIEVGAGGTSPVVGDTTLVSPVVRLATTVSGGTPSGNSVTYATTLNPGVGTGALQEAGIFNASSAGTMLARTTFAVINKAAGDALTISWTVSLT